MYKLILIKGAVFHFKYYFTPLIFYGKLCNPKDMLNILIKIQNLNSNLSAFKNADENMKASNPLHLVLEC